MHLHFNIIPSSTSCAIHFVFSMHNFEYTFNLSFVLHPEHIPSHKTHFHGSCKVSCPARKHVVCIYFLYPRPRDVKQRSVRCLVKPRLTAARYRPVSVHYNERHLVCIEQTDSSPYLAHETRASSFCKENGVVLRMSVGEGGISKRRQVTIMNFLPMA
jgi:hypothetical protein